MDTQSKYTGLVTLKFFDEEGNLKTITLAHNRGTPYLFSVLSDILEKGTESRNDYRPGKIMLTNEGIFTIDEQDDGSISYDSSVELRTLIPQVSVQTNLEVPLYGPDDSEIIDPCVRYEFHISSYDLNTESIANLNKHRFWLISANESQFLPMPITLNKDGGLISDDDSSNTKMNFLLDRITWKSVMKDEKAPKICAEVLLIDENDDIDYSLNKGEYVSVLWDMHFSNKENN